MSEAPLHRLYHHYSELPGSMRLLFTAALVILGLGYTFALIKDNVVAVGTIDLNQAGHRR